jgi:hypothetical protein
MNQQVDSNLEADLNNTTGSSAKASQESMYTLFGLQQPLKI